MYRKRINPGPGQESVWDYPRPPRLEESTRHLQVIFGGVVIADTRHALRILETSHPPVYYFPPTDVQMDYLQASTHATFCEWKGAASYYTLSANGKQALDAAWSYAQPAAPYAALAHYLAFYPSRVEQCLVDGELVKAQPGDFYGGWITSEIVGPFKGAQGTAGW
jgi:uncharacterized protein (DUF427 family)